MKLTKKQIRKNREWKHLTNCLPEKVCWIENFEKIDMADYNPEDWREAWYRYDTYGKKSVTAHEIKMLEPLKQAKGRYNLFLSSLVEEAMEWWSKGYGWYMPIYCTLRTTSDRITKVAILKIVRKLNEDPLAFFISHPFIRSKPDLMNKYLNYKIQDIDNESKK